MTIDIWGSLFAFATPLVVIAGGLLAIVALITVINAVGEFLDACFDLFWGTIGKVFRWIFRSIRKGLAGIYGKLRPL